MSELVLAGIQLFAFIGLLVVELLNRRYLKRLLRKATDGH